MITKKNFLMKLKNTLSNYISMPVAETTIRDMNSQRLGEKKDSSPLSEQEIDESLITIFSRISFVKGDLAAESFVSEFNNWRYGK